MLYLYVQSLPVISYFQNHTCLKKKPNQANEKNPNTKTPFRNRRNCVYGRNNANSMHPTHFNSICKYLGKWQDLSYCLREQCVLLAKVCTQVL